MGANNLANTVLDNSAGGAGTVDTNLQTIEKLTLLDSSVNLNPAATISTGLQNITNYASVSIYVAASHPGVLTIMMSNDGALGLMERDYTMMPNTPLTIRLPIDTKVINVTYTNGGTVTTYFTIGVYATTISDDTNRQVAEIIVAKTTTPLGVSQTYNSEWVRTVNMNKVNLCCRADQVGTVGIVLSNDGTTSLGSTVSSAVPANTTIVIEQVVTTPFIRVTFINSTTAQGALTLWARMSG